MPKNVPKGHSPKSVSGEISSGENSDPGSGAAYQNCATKPKQEEVQSTLPSCHCKGTSLWFTRQMSLGPPTCFVSLKGSRRCSTPRCHGRVEWGAGRVEAVSPISLRKAFLGKEVLWPYGTCLGLPKIEGPFLCRSHSFGCSIGTIMAVSSQAN